MQGAKRVTVLAAQSVVLTTVLGLSATLAIAFPQRSIHNKHVTPSALSQTSTSSVTTTTTQTVSATAPSITTQPTSEAVTPGQSATFMVAVTGTAPLTYQWKKNSTAISGATSSTYVTPATTTSDNQSQFSVVISNGAGSVTSKPATLTVNSAPSVLNTSATSVSFGTVNVSSNNTRYVTLTNTGTSPVTISSVAVTGAGFNESGGSGVMLSGGQTATLSAIFDPATAGSVTGSITVTSNAANSPLPIALSGTGQAPTSYSVSLSWAPSGSTISGYNVYSSTVSGGPYSKITAAPVSLTKYMDSSVQSGHDYYYVVTSVNSQNQESPYSGQVSAIIP